MSNVQQQYHQNCKMINDQYILMCGVAFNRENVEKWENKQQQLALSTYHGRLMVVDDYHHAFCDHHLL